MNDFRMIDAGGTRIRAVVRGSGPLVIMVHGYPESWYSWRHQIDPIAQAGFTACAIDVRGYGGSAKPPLVEAYTLAELAADVEGVAKALQPDAPAILIGHDWGAPIVWNSALSRPEAFSAVAALSVPFRGVPERSWKEVFHAMYTAKNRFFYQVYFEQVGRAERAFDGDPRDFLRTFYYGSSGDAPADAWPTDKTADAALLDGMTRPGTFPAWMTDADLDYFVEEFTRSGMFGPLNRYRNHDRDFEWSQQFKSRKIEQPALFIAGNRDLAFTLMGGNESITRMREQVPNLQGAHILPGCGHWTQQERPEEVTKLLVDWLKGLR